MFLHPGVLYASMPWADPWADPWSRHCPSSLHPPLPSVECISLCIHHFDGAACSWLAWSERVKCVLACYELGSFLHVAESCTVSEWPQDMITNACMQQYMFDILCSRVPVRLCAVLHQLSPGNGMHAWRLLCEWFYTSAPHELGACDGSSLSRAPASAWERNTPCEAPSDKMQLLADDRMLLHFDECTEHDDSESTDECVPDSDVAVMCVSNSDVAECTDASVPNAGTVMCVSGSDVVECTDTCVSSSFCGLVHSTSSDKESRKYASAYCRQPITCDLQHTKHDVEQFMQPSNMCMHHAHASMATLDMRTCSPYAVKHFFTTALQTG